MKGITIKLPETLLRRLRGEARQNGCSVAALVRERIESPPGRADSVYSLSAGLAGSVSGSRRAASNARAKFRRP